MVAYSWGGARGTLVKLDEYGNADVEMDSGGLLLTHVSSLQAEGAPGGPARWALALYRECQRDAAADPWWEPGGAERRFLAKLREYAGEAE